MKTCVRRLSEADGVPPAAPANAASHDCYGIDSTLRFVVKR